MNKVTVVIPCYRVQTSIEAVIRGIPKWVHRIVAVNDCSDDNTGRVLDQLKASEPRLDVVHLKVNQGVGGAFLAGADRAIELGAEVIVKMDGDGQMDPLQLSRLVNPIIRGEADFCKASRFTKLSHLSGMPVLRVLGNAGLSFMLRFSSGYWNILDPTNGYFAGTAFVFENLPKDQIDSRYFFESSQIIALGSMGAVIKDVPMRAIYGDETSHLSIGKTLVEFPPKILIGLLRRIWYRKVLLNFTMETILGAIGLFAVCAGLIFGAIEYQHYSIELQEGAPLGTILLAVTPIILGFQFLLMALLIDVMSIPKDPISPGQIAPNEL